MATLNIYVPESLKSQMEGAERVNWSAVCQQAIRNELLTYEARTTMNIDAIAERVKATSGKNSRKYLDGFEDGKAWAAESADADDMEALLDIEGFHELEEASAGHLEASGAAVELARRLGSDEWIWGDDWPTSTKFVQGFFEGAREILIEVNKRI